MSDSRTPGRVTTESKQDLLAAIFAELIDGPLMGGPVREAVRKNRRERTRRRVAERARGLALIAPLSPTHPVR
jgi:hypothetical protein